MESKLFEPFTIRGLTLKNRIVRSATGEGVATPDGDLVDAHYEMYEALAKGGAGLIVSGHMFVKENGRASKGMAGIHNDDLIPQWRKLTDIVHEYGGVIAAQINHAGRQSTEEIIGETPIAPSAVTNKANGVTPREATVEEILDLIECYAAAAARAKDAGFDAVQLHCAHGYLMSQFISPYTNQRTDEWGGSTHARMSFVLDVLRAVRERAGADYPVMIKLNAEDFIDGGLTLKMSREIAEALEREGIDAIEISGGMAETVSKIVRTNIRTPDKEAYFRPYAEAFRKAVKTPLMLVGGIRSRAVMDAVLNDDVADFVSLCRPFIREPDLPNKLAAGEIDVVGCISCNACLSRRKEGEPLRCLADR